MAVEARIELPPKLIDVFTGEARYRGAHGGRGSAKTRTFALMSAVRGYALAQSGRTGAILCGREFMNSLEDSSMEEVKQAIRSVPWLDRHYDIGEKFIRTRDKRISYLFAGLRHNLDSIKSKARVHLAWIDEAENVSAAAWQKLVPTVREPGSEIWVTWNPEKDGSPTDQRFRKNTPTRSRIAQVNYSDNPWFPPELEEERQNDLVLLDDDTYQHIWDGAYQKRSKAQIFADKYRVAEFEPGKDWHGPYQGIDWGFALDPTTAVRCWVHDQRLYVEYDAGKVGLELDHTTKFIGDRIDGFDKFVARADSARPESISYVNRHGMPRVAAAAKGKGSVEDGIAHIRSYKEVVIHPRCAGTLSEFRLYSYKVDRLSGDVLPDVVDAHNHYIDAIRYSLEPVMKKSLYNLGNAL
ncbi:PBSX family phage terminase large subunit [Xanthomonas arboricola]|uniref:PBSX family phage terminase large subunit n=1 Tax=Xanthomonas arboricola TaxID=56448 RepID=UPI000CEDA3EE|nr:PBSX family phage terminase large subunit [Xanthomonas arboricola]PPU41834.1 terminase [Xanthomonas arboricola pv. populi]